MRNPCSGAGQMAVVPANGIGYQCPRCGLLTIPYKNGVVRRHCVLETAPPDPPVGEIEQYQQDVFKALGVKNWKDAASAANGLRERIIFTRDFETLRFMLDQHAELVQHWRDQAAQYDTVHATMGSGWKACADDLAAALAGRGRPRPPQET